MSVVHWHMPLVSDVSVFHWHIRLFIIEVSAVHMHTFLLWRRVLFTLAGL